MEHRIRELAAARGDACFTRARAALLDPRADLELRVSARSVLRATATLATPSAERDMTLVLLQQQWGNVTLTQNLGSVRSGFQDIANMDETLQSIDPTFTPASDARIDRWLEVMLSPFDPADPDPRKSAQYMADRWIILSQLTRFGPDAPGKVAPRIILEMNTPDRPMQLRVGLAQAVQGMYQQAAEPNDEWEATLQRFYPGAFAVADPHVLRLLPSAILHGAAHPVFQTKRKFIASKSRREAMNVAYGRMIEAANSSPRESEAVSAVADLRGGIEVEAAVSRRGKGVMGKGSWERGHGKGVMGKGSWERGHGKGVRSIICAS